MKRLVDALRSRAFRRGVAGDPVWLGAAVMLWLVARARRSDSEIVWSGKLDPGEALTVLVESPARRGSTTDTAGGEVSGLRSARRRRGR
ncbi:MAG: hypothetical protein ACYCTL_09505 [Acidimicrobiales bacterium]